MAIGGTADDTSKRGLIEEGFDNRGRGIAFMTEVQLVEDEKFVVGGCHGRPWSLGSGKYRGVVRYCLFEVKNIEIF